MFRMIAVIVVVFFCFSCRQNKIPHINIIKEGNVDWYKKEPCVVQYSNNSDMVELPGRIRLRGGYSVRFYKRSYSLELNEKFTFIGLPNDDDWILNAN